MALHAAIEQNTLSKKPLFTYRWMRYFFTDTTPLANNATADLQRRAVWIGLALILQSLNEISHDLYMPFLKAPGALIPFALFLGSFYAIWQAFRPTPKQHTTRQGQPHLWQRIILILTLLLTIAGAIEFGRSIVMTFLPPQFTNDGTSLDTNAAILLLEGRNPYTDSNLPDIIHRFYIRPIWTTPLRVGPFAGRLDYPSDAELQTVFDASLKANNMPAFEGKVSYPSLSFLTLVPFVFLNDYNVLPFYLLSYLLLVYIAWKIAYPAIRPWILLLALANVPMWASTVGGNLDIFYTLLIVLAWLLRDHRWRTALFLGLALASKQIAWYFLPFYLLMTLRNYGLKETLYRTIIAGGIGLLLNLPFILWNPQTWFAGVMAPIADPMFPSGVGLISLSVSHLLPFFPERVYSLLEYGAMLVALLVYWRICRKYPEAALLLAIIPLFLAWRSLSSYFYCIAFPLFILTTSRLQPSSLLSIWLPLPKTTRVQTQELLPDQQ